MKITLRQLRYLDALAAEGHFGRAAERAAVSQPALSAQIRELEDALGCQLVERAASGARLTPAGKEIVERGRRILTEVGDLEAFARVAADPMVGSLRLGIIPSIGPYLLPKLLPSLASAFPALRVGVRETVTATLVGELQDGGLDLVIASLPLGDPSFREIAVFSDAFLLATPATGPLSLGAFGSAADIPTEALLLLEDGHCLRDQTLASCGALDARRLTRTGVTSLATILQLVAAGQGITLLPELFLASTPLEAGRVRLRRFDAPEPHRTVGLAWRRSSPLSTLCERIAGLIAEMRPELDGVPA
ncbi:LysR family transcriptional regulator [Pleomorphomonas diazotrophica]|uniref:LysR family transcriptional regulator n=1 Tax=Pleomorphomonas diazotrophica TaxID=1166257 RepID=A0A1I4R306_9HYPH|nr:LysR substrate-binding domain-containing protein [Pleomorphomonas diazotrophica]PKR90238.1 LysR family transcriptional regulator [Pleomorphomonas diazotrophica]SFM46649.1 transcriptional regulator, LysR family [Pleomorphomonas diazotrophica]